MEPAFPYGWMDPFKVLTLTRCSREALEFLIVKMDRFDAV